MSARTQLEACIQGLEDSLGVPATKNGSTGAAGTVRAPASELLDGAIATLEASLGLQPGEAVGGTATANGETRGGAPAGESAKSRAKAKKAGIADGGGKKGGKGAAKNSPASAQQQPDGTKVDLRVGLITNVWTHESADKLYCEEIDVGEGTPRNIASGLVPHYSLEEMKGRRVVVMCNLKPRNLKGFKSQGMVVCAAQALDEGKEKVELVEPPEGAAVGERLSLEGVEGGPFEPVSAAQMDKKKVLEKVLPELTTDGEGTVRWREHALVSSCGPCTAPSVRNGAVR